MARRRKNYNYRTVYTKHHGPIPKDEFGRSFDVHHLNGDPDDDRPENLIAVSVAEHYRIHMEQGDYAAAALIAKRANAPLPDTTGERNTFYGKRHTRESMRKMVQTRRESGDGDYHHGTNPGTLDAVRIANSRRLKTDNPMKDADTVQAVQSKRLATVKSFDYWKTKYFDPHEKSKQIQEYILNSSDRISHLSLIREFNITRDFAVSISRRFNSKEI